MKNRVKSIVGIGILVLVFTFVGWALIQRGEERAKKELERPTPSPARVSVEQGRTVVILDPDTQARLGIGVAELDAATTREQLRATAVVLSAQDLIDLRNAFVAVQANAEKVRANLEVARKEYERLKLLNQENQNASLKAVEAEEGALRSTQADVKAAEEQVQLQQVVVQQRWGDVVSKWLTGSSPAFERVTQQKGWLVQVTLSAGSSLMLPKRVSLQLPGGAVTEAQFVSPYPRLDPRIQGPSFLYLTAHHAGLAPGLNLLAQLPVGHLLRGVTIPESSVVWWKGKAWAYQQLAPDKFARQQVETNMAVPGGWFVATGFSPRQKVVVRGAQALLSAETRPVSGTTGEEGGPDD